MANKKYEIGPYDFDPSAFPITKSPFGYFGSKLSIASKIVNNLPPHNAWVEAFCGSASVTLAKAPVQIEIINDVDDQIVNLFDQLRNNTKALCRDVTLTPYARKEFIRAREHTDAGNALERARRFLVATMMTINGTIGNKGCGFSFSSSYARHGCEARVNRWYNLPQRLTDIADRLKHIRIENRDARELLEMFADRPATLVYLDPPYLMQRKHGYKIDTNYESFHRDMLNICNRCKCMIFISSYESALYDEYLTRDNGWRKRRIETRTRGTTGRDYVRTEVIWENRHFASALKSGNVPIHLTKHERKYNKINPSR